MRQSFSPELPTLQTAWDSTSLTALKTCPRKYQYSIVLGWVPRKESVHLTFGLHFHSSLETYDKLKALGASHKVATRHAVRHAMTVTWNATLNRPWFSDDQYKNRFTLVRSVVWYLEQFGENDALRTIQLANGKPAVELSFRFALGKQTHTTKEELLLCGHIDRLAQFDGTDNIYISDRKTTKGAIYEEYFQHYTPDNQMSTYYYAGQVVWQIPVHDIIIDAAQIGVGFTRFQRGFVHRTPGQIEEWRNELDHYLAMAEHFAREDYWPQNDAVCSMYGGCPYRPICGRSPNTRDEWLRASYVQRIWDPLVARGDI